MDQEKISKRSPDLHLFTLQMLREWLERYYPEAKYAVVIVELGNGLPAVQVPILQPSPTNAAS